MPRHIEAWMDGRLLSTIGPFLIQQVYENAPALEITEGERPGRYGQRLLQKKRQTLQVALEIAIRERFDLALRAKALEALAAWAQGSVLELSHRPERMLRCVCTSEPALSEVRNYTTAIRVEFTAYDVPYWEDRTASGIALSGVAGAGTLLIPGTVETPVQLTVEPTGETLTDLTVTAGGEEIVLSRLQIPSGGVLTFERSGRDDLAIAYNGASQLSHRSASSSDDLLLPPGSTEVSFSANTACTVAFSVRGRWA